MIREVGVGVSPMMGVSTPAIWEHLDVSDATCGAGFACSDLTTFCRLDELGLEVTGQRLEEGRACWPAGWWSRTSGVIAAAAKASRRYTVQRRLAHEPFGWRPTVLVVTIRRYRCTGCGHVWRQDTSAAAERRAKLSRRGLRWALEGIVVQHLTVTRVAGGLGVSWNTANDAVLAEGRRVLIDVVARFDGVRAIGVDEHVWRHTRRGGKYVTVIIDLTAVRDGTGAARLLDMVEGRSKQVFKTWLAGRPQAWRDAVEVVAMDGFTGERRASLALADFVEDSAHLLIVPAVAALVAGNAEVAGDVPDEEPASDGVPGQLRSWRPARRRPRAPAPEQASVRPTMLAPSRPHRRCRSWPGGGRDAAARRGLAAPRGRRTPPRPARSRRAIPNLPSPPHRPSTRRGRRTVRSPRHSPPPELAKLA